MPPKQKTTRQHLAFLEKAARQAGPALYRRLQSVAAILNDSTWLEQNFAGRRGEAELALKVRYFPEFTEPLAAVLNLLAVFPAEATWQEHAYDLCSLLYQWQEDQPPVLRLRRTRPTWALVYKLYAQIAALTAALAAAQAQLPRRHRRAG